MKYDISSIMKAAWSEARHYAKSRTGSAREFFDFCLRQAWFEARSQRLSGTQKQIAYARDLQEDMQSFLVSLHDKVMKAGKNPEPAYQAWLSIEFFCGHAGRLIDTIKAAKTASTAREACKILINLQ
ncbi:hypothetical protein [Serratia marcescens]|uniref:hypothetical protein n=1 Tax=Serratia marcescens TaxID=615 RepID=UPI000CCEB1CA|nr:hypothetical protein [Serratia marcescens]PNU36538.1 hypothetical protein C2M05_04085 [Serratia marcescens]